MPIAKKPTRSSKAAPAPAPKKTPARAGSGPQAAAMLAAAAMAPRPKAKTAVRPKVDDTTRLTATVREALDDMKALDIKIMPVGHLTSMWDVIMLATGTSTRHVSAIAESVIEKAKAIGHRPLGSQGLDGAEWAVVDLNAVAVHVMQSAARANYQIEKLWDIPPPPPPPPVAAPAPAPTPTPTVAAAVKPAKVSKSATGQKAPTSAKAPARAATTKTAKAAAAPAPAAPAQKPRSRKAAPG